MTLTHASVSTMSGRDSAASQPITYFAGPTSEALAIEAATAAAYAEARALYGDEDGEAWLAALEDGTHPLCRIKSAASSC